MTQDTRKDRRVKIVSLNVRYKSATVDEFIENHAHDVSRGGIYIKTANPFPAGTLLKFEIRLASDQAVIAGVGRVVWKRDAAHGQGERPAGMGVKFIKIDPPSSAVIDKLVNTRSDAGKAFEAEAESSTDAPPPVLQAPPPASAPAAAAPATKSAVPPKPAPGGPPVRKATMMGIGTTSAPAAPSASSVPSSPPRPTASVPPRPTPHAAAGPLFPKGSPEAEAPKQEQTVMKQAAELLEEALREAGGSMEDVGTNPLFAGGSAPAAPATAEEAPAEDDATKARALAAGLAPAAVEEKKGPSEPPPRTTRDTPIAKVSERPRSSARPAAPYVARVSDAPAPVKKSGSGGTILILVTAAAAAAAVVMYKDKLFGGGAAEPQQPPAAVHSAEPPPSSSSSSSSASAAATAPASAAPAQSAEAPAASAQASASAATSAQPAGSASGAAAPGASAAPSAAPQAKAAAAAPAPKPAPTATPAPTTTAAPPAATPPPAPKPAAPKPKPKAADEDNPY